MEAILCWYWLKGEDIWLTRQVWAHYCCCHQHMTLMSIHQDQWLC